MWETALILEQRRFVEIRQDCWHQMLSSASSSLLPWEFLRSTRHATRHRQSVKIDASASRRWTTIYPPP